MDLREALERAVERGPDGPYPIHTNLVMNREQGEAIEALMEDPKTSTQSKALRKVLDAGFRALLASAKRRGVPS